MCVRMCRAQVNFRELHWIFKGVNMMYQTVLIVKRPQERRVVHTAAPREGLKVGAWMLSPHRTSALSLTLKPS